MVSEIGGQLNNALHSSTTVNVSLRKLIMRLVACDGPVPVAMVPVKASCGRSTVHFYFLRASPVYERADEGRKTAVRLSSVYLYSDMKKVR